MAFEVVSNAFSESKPIPKNFTGEGEDKSPPLKWRDVPDGTKELALICDDPDAPRDEPFVHWVAYKIPVSINELPMGLPKVELLDRPTKILQGKNDFGEIGYDGPMPPKGHGLHHYHFKLYALNDSLPLKPGMRKEELLRAIKKHVLASTEFVGTYERN